MTWSFRTATPTQNAYLIALDKQTGKEVWRTKRRDHRGWSTPIVVTAGQRRELVLNGHEGVQAYDPATGRELWFCKSPVGRGEPTVTPAGDVLCVVNGLTGGEVYSRAAGRQRRRDRARTCPGTRPAEAAATAPRRSSSATSSSSATWKASPPATARKTATSIGRSGWSGKYSGSPIAASGLVYILNEAGKTFVIKPGPTLEVVAENELVAGKDEIFRASPRRATGSFSSAARPCCTASATTPTRSGLKGNNWPDSSPSCRRTWPWQSSICRSIRRWRRRRGRAGRSAIAACRTSSAACSTSGRSPCWSATTCARCSRRCRWTAGPTRALTNFLTHVDARLAPAEAIAKKTGNKNQGVQIKVPDPGPFSEYDTDLGKFSHGNFDAMYIPGDGEFWIVLKVKYKFEKGITSGEQTAIRGRMHLAVRAWDNAQATLESTMFVLNPVIRIRFILREVTSGEHKTMDVENGSRREWVGMDINIHKGHHRSRR